MLNVIIVDDELLMRIGLKSMINWEEHGFYMIGEAANGKEALELALQHSPDLIITDIKMPVMDGLELIRQASQHFSNCQYVILSCLDEFQYAKEALRLGAVDYLIKSDMKQQQLLDVLSMVKKKNERLLHNSGGEVFKQHYKEGIGYLKESLFKELFSGFRNEEEIVSRSKALGISLVQGSMVLIKLRIDRFERIRQKYVEQDEKLLRYAVINMMEELIPRKWRREVIVESSSEYLLIMNMPEMEGEPENRSLLGYEEVMPKDRLDRLFASISGAMKDYLNISLSIGISGVASGYNGLRKAYQEADMALRLLFFEREGNAIYFEDGTKRLRNNDSFVLSREEESRFRRLVEEDEAGAQAYLEQLWKKADAEGVTENEVRKLYFRLLTLMNSCFPSIPETGARGYTPYELLLQEERLYGLHELLIHYLQQCLTHNQSTDDRNQSYAEQASEIIMNHYAEDLSLQSVANQINVNPSYLSRIFKQETGSNFVSFLTRVRMDRAQHFLKGKNMKVYEVAEMVGYPNTAYFSKLFKKVTGATPEEYRARATKSESQK
ncbi:response regulator [Paenibacillus sp. NEAU-GSW1]|uniref:response regulator n=1 Tax=Paenibacillus sp. NEAU-GSW1 TaxID=2682486 RepID=UPI0012E1FFF7|nr:response regulator [Paenibacillus sp. NEAU-GSW1]MUT68262.1 response regulator [Paenibacillus sp. NEAU-GSW1]